MFTLDNSLAIVTGGASGIGLSVARTLATAGACVAILDLDVDAAKSQAAEINSNGFQATAVPVDLADEDSVLEACKAVLSEHGSPWLLVNNAGVQDRQLLLEGTADEWDRMNRINARSAFLTTREIGNAMVTAGNGGRIVNIATLALRGSLAKGLASNAPFDPA